MGKRKLNNYQPQVAQKNSFLQNYIFDKKLSVNDIKLFKAILSKVKYNDSLFSENYIIDYSVLDIVGIPSANRYREVEKSLINLMNTFVTIRQKDREKINDPLLNAFKGDRKLGLIRNDWTHKKRSSQILITIPEILKPFFLELADKEYTIYNLENLSAFKRVYELKLYELFARWKNRGYVNITIENLREYLEIEENKYPLYASFKSYILVRAIKLISETTNLNINYRELKKNGEILTTNKGPGNKAHSIEFIITDKEKFEPEKYKGKKFKASDGKAYMILKVEKTEGDYISVKLFDEDTDTITKLSRPVLIKDFVENIVD